jgi:hypothetical protein
MDPMDGNKGEFFVTHSKNYDKFAKRQGFEVLGHGFDRGAMTLAARRATVECGEAYQPKFSAFRTPLSRPETAEEPSDELSPTLDETVDFLSETGIDIDDNN